MFDEKENLILKAAGKKTASGEVMKLVCGEKTAAKIRELKLSVFKAFSISSAGESVKILITQSAGAFSVRFHGISWLFRGDFAAGGYEIVDADGVTVAAASRHFSKGFTEITVFSPARETLCIAAALCLESMEVRRSPALRAANLS